MSLLLLSTPRPNLILNPDFESGSITAPKLVGWSASPDWTWILWYSVADEGITPQKGSHYISIFSSGSNYIYQRFVVTPGSKYKMTLWFYLASARGRYRIVDVSNSADIKALTNVNISLNAWVDTSYTFTAPAGCTLVELRLYGIASNGYSTNPFDSISVVKLN